MSDGGSESSLSRPGRRSILVSIARGFLNRCPNCRQGELLAGYLMPHEACSSCGERNGEIMAHDAPPYITILIVGHVIVPLLLISEKLASPPLWVQFTVWLPATVLLMLGLLPRVKGAWMGFMWALSLRGLERQ